MGAQKLIYLSGVVQGPKGKQGIKTLEFALKHLGIPLVPSQILEPEELFAVCHVDELTVKITSTCRNRRGKTRVFSRAAGFPPIHCGHLNCRLS